MLRPIPIRRYLTVMQSRGFEAQQVLAGTGIECARLEDSSYLIEHRQYQRLIENMIALAGDDGLGLDVGLARDITDFGAMGYAALSCGSVGQAFEEVWGRYGDSLGMMANVVVPPARGETLNVEIITMGTTESVQRFLIEEALLLMFKVGGKMMGGKEPSLSNLQFAFPAPHYRERYTELFHCPVEFDAPRSCAVVKREWMERPLMTRDGALRQLFQRHLGQLRQEVETGLATSVRLRRLFAQCGSRLPLLDDAARSLGVSSRTIRRQLQGEGLCYRQLLESFRMELALDCIKSGITSAKQISQRTGFSDVTAFRRSFKHWTGQTLCEYRRTPPCEHRL